MSSKLSVEEVLSTLEEREVFHRDREAFHTQQEAHHRDQGAFHAAELEKVRQSLEAFRAVSASAVDLAKPVPKAVPAAAAETAELPPPGRLFVSRLLRRVVASPDLKEPFSPATVAAEANRRFKDHLEEPISPRTASDVLRRLVAEGRLQLAKKGGAAHAALYARKPRQGGK